MSSSSGKIRDFVSTYQSTYRGRRPATSDRGMAEGVGRILSITTGLQLARSILLIVVAVALAIWAFAAGWDRLGLIAIACAVVAVPLILYWRHVSHDVHRAREQ